MSFNAFEAAKVVAVDVQAKAGNVLKGHLEELQIIACPWVRVKCNVGTLTVEQIDHVGFCKNA